MTDEELNEIASRLRRTANDSLGGESLQKALARITVAEDVSWRGVMRRIADLIDRGECENVYDGSVQDSCDNGFKCSVCGCKVEDEEHYRVSGVWNYCPECGRWCGMADRMRLAPSPSVELLRPDGPAA